MFLKAQLVAAAISLLTISANAADAKYPVGKYEVDPPHSSVGFEVPHLVISTVEGRFMTFEGTVELNENFEKSSVKASVETKSVDTGNAKRDDHLRTGDFFEASKFDKLTFVSKTIKGTPESFEMTGDLTIKGKTKSVKFDGKYLGSVKNDGNGREKVAFNAKAKINRKEFGLVYGGMVEAGPVIGDEVTIILKIQAAHPAPGAPAKK